MALRLRLTWGTHFVCRFLVSLLVVLMVPDALGAGPRYVTGPPFFTGQQGLAIGWKQANLLYFTDPGSLSASVNHQAADALVAAAANVWNLPVANITVGQGGELAEHVSGQNTYMGANGMVFPADVMNTNAVAIPIAVIYDTDGSVTETLLGAGSSDPSECRQDGVTESVDGFDPAGYIRHAVIVLNGRCTGAAPQLQFQMQYQLMRAFGRVLGLAWSQTNDNVFTGTPTPTYQQELNWPIMHPIDIICGSYTYQCLANPFQLRPDDVASMVAVYPVTQAVQGKQVSLSNASGQFGVVTFPTGQGMAGVNVLVQPQDGSATSWSQVSGVTGTTSRRAGVSQFVSAGNDALSSMGRTDQYLAGLYTISYFPMPANATSSNVHVKLEAVNALYSGEHSLGPYGPGNVTPSGTAATLPGQVNASEGWASETDAMIADAASTCGNGADGTAYLPMELPATGWWNGLLCAYGHASYISADVKPGRTFTVEVTALDAQGYATMTKAMPVIGVFAPTDGATPSLALAATAFQAWSVGTTTASASTGQLTNVTIGIADERGDGRPDYNYQARMFYADSVTPARIATAGATVTITGSGFRAGNAVSINGVAVSVVSWTANVVVVTAPAISVVGATNQVAVDVVVSDRATGATSRMTAALTYDSTAGLPNAMRVVSVPTASVFAGTAAAVPFTVQVVAADGVTPVVGDTVVFSTSGAQFGSCGAASCAVVTNAQGMASETVLPTAAGTVTVTATDGALQQNGSFLVEAQAGSIVILSAPSGSVNVGVQAQNFFAVQVLAANGSSMAHVPVVFSTAIGGATFSACSTAPCTVMTDNYGNAWTWVTPTSMGTVTLQAAVGGVGQTVSFTGASNVDVMQVASSPSASVWTNESPGQFLITLLHPDGSADSLEPVTFTVSGGLTFGTGGSSTYISQTTYSGTAGVTLPYTATAGTYTVRASFGSVFQTFTFTVQNHSYQISLVSQPASNGVPYVSSAVPFAVRVTQDGTTPVANATVQVTGVLSDMTFDACGDRTCQLTTDANGMVSSTVTPLAGGTIVMSAVSESVVLNTSFTVVGVPASFRIVEQPGPAGLVTGATQVLMVALIGTDGVTPLDGQRVYFNVVSGPFAFTNCTAATCMQGTCCGGLAPISGQAYGPGPVTVQVAYGSVTALIQFNAVALPDVLKLVSAPSSGGYAGQAESNPFVVQAFFNDGVTPVSGRNVTVSVTNGQAGLVACAGASSCVLTADANGMISTQVTPSTAGSITITATDGGVSVSSSFTAVAKPDVMTVITAPVANTYVGATTTFTVKVSEGDGVTPRVGARIAFTGTAGAVQFGPCGTSTCTVVTGADGSATVTVTPVTAGTIALQAVDGILVQTVTFPAQARPDTLSVLSAPGNGSWVGVVATNLFSVRLLQGDGVTPDAGKTIILSALGATLGVCGATTCAVVTDANGMVSATVTPNMAGTVLLTASGNGLTAAASFTATVRPDVMSVVSVPANGSLVGSAAATLFSVRLLQGDGVTADVGKTITLSAAGGTLGACGAASCALVTDASGMVTTSVTPSMAGVVSLLAVDGVLTQTASFTAVRADVLSVVSAPANGSWVGSAAATVFAVRMLHGDGVTPDAEKAITLSVSGATLGACGGTSCLLVTDSNGMASSVVTPSVAGLVTLAASGNGLTATVTFSAVNRPDLLQIVGSPVSGALVGDVAANPLVLQVLAGDGVTPVAGRSVMVTVTNGAATLTACGAASCLLTTDAHGDVSTGVIPLAPGTVVLTATEASGGSAAQTASFTAKAKPDLFSLVTTPGASVLAGVVAGTPLAVKVVLADGVTPVAGIAVTFAVVAGGGTASFGGCNASVCVVTTGADGVASTPVSGGLAGSVTLSATANLPSGMVTLTTTMTVLPNRYALTTLSGTVYVAEGAIVPVTLRAAAMENGAVSAGQVVQWTEAVGFTLAATSTLTDVSGTTAVEATLGPLMGGSQGLATACAWTNVCVTFAATGVAAGNQQVAITNGGQQAISGGAAFAPVTLQVVDRSGHAVVGAAVSVYQTVTALDVVCAAPGLAQGRCPAAAVLASDVTVMSSAGDGRVTLAPITVSGVATSTEIAVSVGTQGFATTVLTNRP